MKSTNKKASVLIAHPGTQHAPRMATVMNSLGVLNKYATGFAIGKGGFCETLDRCSPKGLRARWARRRVLTIPAHLIGNLPRSEIAAMIRLKQGRATEAVFHARNAAFQQEIPDRWIEAASHVIGFDTSSWLLAERCVNIGRPFILDQTIAHARSKEEVYAHLRKQWPAWSDVSAPKAEALIALEDREHQFATKIIAPCSYVRTTLLKNGVPASKIVVLPYGVDVKRFKLKDRKGESARPLRFLFLGHVIARKGVPVLLDAWRRVSSLGGELWIAGHVANHIRPLIPEINGLRLLGRVPEKNLTEIFQECDVFVFPSLFEGYGLVLLEAMASGLPIIATDATAGPDLVSHREEGLVVPSGDAEKLAEALAWFLSNSKRVPEMGQLARVRAEKLSWQIYGEDLLRLIESV